jgi:hypothetical protein
MWRYIITTIKFFFIFLFLLFFFLFFFFFFFLLLLVTLQLFVRFALLLNHLPRFSIHSHLTPNVKLRFPHIHSDITIPS